MLLAFQVFATLSAALHVVIFLMESVLWAEPAVHRRFGVRTAAEAAAIKPMAYNQGFYNLFLAVGILTGLAVGGDRGELLAVFSLCCVVAAALALISTGASYARAAASQGAFAVIALALWALLPA